MSQTNEYSIYMQSGAWEAKREKALELADYYCNRCGEESGARDHFNGGKIIIDVHHKTYERLGNELMSDLECLCRECHDDEHEKKG